MLADAIRRALSERKVDGVIVSSGACQVQGAFTDETFRGALGVSALRSCIAPLRVRETIVVPLSEVGRQQIAMWLDIYNAESTWLRGAIAAASLKNVPELG